MKLFSWLAPEVLEQTPSPTDKLGSDQVLNTADELSQLALAEYKEITDATQKNLNALIRDIFVNFLNDADMRSITSTDAKKYLAVAQRDTNFTQYINRQGLTYNGQELSSMTLKKKIMTAMMQALLNVCCDKDEDLRTIAEKFPYSVDGTYGPNTYYVLKSWYESVHGGATFDGKITKTLMESLLAEATSTDVDVVTTTPDTKPDVVTTTPDTKPDVVTTTPDTKPDVVTTTPDTKPDVVTTTPDTKPDVVTTTPDTKPDVVTTTPDTKPDVVTTPVETVEQAEDRKATEIATRVGVTYDAGTDLFKYKDQTRPRNTREDVLAGRKQGIDLDAAAAAETELDTKATALAAATGVGYDTVMNKYQYKDQEKPRETTEANLRAWKAGLDTPPAPTDPRPIEVVTIENQRRVEGLNQIITNKLTEAFSDESLKAFTVTDEAGKSQTTKFEKAEREAILGGMVSLKEVLADITNYNDLKKAIDGAVTTLIRENNNGNVITGRVYGGDGNRTVGTIEQTGGILDKKKKERRLFGKYLNDFKADLDKAIQEYDRPIETWGYEEAPKYTLPTEVTNALAEYTTATQAVESTNKTIDGLYTTIASKVARKNELIATIGVTSDLATKNKLQSELRVIYITLYGDDIIDQTLPGLETGQVLITADEVTRVLVSQKLDKPYSDQLESQKEILGDGTTAGQLFEQSEKYKEYGKALETEKANQGTLLGGQMEQITTTETREKDLITSRYVQYKSTLVDQNAAAAQKLIEITDKQKTGGYPGDNIELNADLGAQRGLEQQAEKTQKQIDYLHFDAQVIVLKKIQGQRQYFEANKSIVDEQLRIKKEELVAKQGEVIALEARYSTITSTITEVLKKGITADRDLVTELRAAQKQTQETITSLKGDIDELKKPGGEINKLEKEQKELGQYLDLCKNSEQIVHSRISAYLSFQELQRIEVKTTILGGLETVEGSVLYYKKQVDDLQKDKSRLETDLQSCATDGSEDDDILRLNLELGNTQARLNNVQTLYDSKQKEFQELTNRSIALETKLGIRGTPTTDSFIYQKTNLGSQREQILGNIKTNGNVVSLSYNDAAGAATGFEVIKPIEEIQALQTELFPDQASSIDALEKLAPVK